MTLALQAMRSLVWFRGNDLRLRDHLPLYHALAEGEVVLAYVFDPVEWQHASQEAYALRSRFQLEAIEALKTEIEARGSALVLLWGSPSVVLPWFTSKFGIQQLLAQRKGDPYGRRVIDDLHSKLDVPVRLFDGETLLSPESLRTGSGDAYSVFTPFSKAAFRQLSVTRPIGAPQRLPPLPPELAALPVTATGRHQSALGDEARILDRLPEFGHERRAATSAPDAALFVGGEPSALSRLKSFVKAGAERYETDRDQLAVQGSSRLSAYLRAGNVSPKQVWWAVERNVSNAESRRRFLTQLLWREFAYSSLWDHPNLLVQPFQPRFEGFPWRRDNDAFTAWVEGRTGYPVVDAAARQLTTEGFVHNRARMIAASFLTKHLIIDPKLGEAHYLKWLVDGDPAQNNLGWQWSSGSGCDAQPYFRIFNPTAQADRFDATGQYVKRYVPELARVPDKYISQPWTMPTEEQRKAGVRIGRDYPAPLVDHAGARNRYLAIAAEHFSRPTGTRAK
jgi:deoxyribodipyrimidine photo-lyase